MRSIAEVSSESPRSLKALGHPSTYNSGLNLKVKVLDSVQFGGCQQMRRQLMLCFDSQASARCVPTKEEEHVEALIIAANREALREGRDGTFQAGSDSPTWQQPLYSASYQRLCRFTIGAPHSREMLMEDANQYSSVRPFIADMKIDAVPVWFQFRVPFAPIYPAPELGVAVSH